jgi:hypothetical protein
MLGSNQRPLPCESNKVFTAVCRRLRKIAVNKPILRHRHRLLLRRLPPFYARVAARLLHNRLCVLWTWSAFQDLAQPGARLGVRLLPQGAEEGADVLSKKLRLLHGGEMSAPRHPAEAPEVSVGRVRATPGGTRNTSSPNVAWRCCGNPARAPCGWPSWWTNGRPLPPSGSGACQ